MVTIHEDGDGGGCLRVVYRWENKGVHGWA
jgi:hypothetical protein